MSSDDVIKSLNTDPSKIIKKFLYTNPAKINFQNASKYLPIYPNSYSSNSFQENDFDGSDIENALTIERLTTLTPLKMDFHSRRSSLNLSSNYFSNQNEYNKYIERYTFRKSDSSYRNDVTYKILQNKKDSWFLYMLIYDIESCETFIKLIKAAYGKDFIYYDDKGWGINGSIDIKSWRVQIACKKHEAILKSGKREFVPQVSDRQKIECNIPIGSKMINATYQIDNGRKLLLGYDGSPFKTTKFNDNFIETENNDTKIRIDRQSGIIIIKFKNIFGSNPDTSSGLCKAVNHEKKF